MSDVLTKEQRSYNMSKIRCRNTIPELNIRKALRAQRIKNYRVKSDLPGKPDILFPRSKILVFVDGCFWHMCPLCYKEPLTRKEFWSKKIESNVVRDQKNNIILSQLGWTVLRYWEHEIKKNADLVALKIRDRIEKS
jgi:DNA mismatch endonuclease (patch repair protein)